MQNIQLLKVLLCLIVCCPLIVQLQTGPALAQMRGIQQASLQPLTTPASKPAQARPEDYVVGAEDMLDVQVFGEDDLNRQVRVNGEGEITLPLVGTIKVAGMTPKAIGRRLVQAYATNYLRDPQINLTVKEYRHERVSVTGAVDKPGYYEIIGPRKLLEILAMAGGPQDKGLSARAGDTVNITRQQSTPQKLIIDLKRLQVQMDPELNVTIHNGDVVHVPFAGNAYVLGGVRNPGCFPVRDNLTLSQALAVAGGTDPVLASSRVQIMRLDDQRNPVTITAHLGKVMSHQEEDVLLKENDVVVVNMSSFKKGLYVFNKLLPGGGGSVSGAYRFAP